jgi:hypothetical protein
MSNHESTWEEAAEMLDTEPCPPPDQTLPAGTYCESGHSGPIRGPERPLGATEAQQRILTEAHRLLDELARCLPTGPEHHIMLDRAYTIGLEAGVQLISVLR